MKTLRIIILFLMAACFYGTLQAQPVLIHFNHGISTATTDRVQAVNYTAPGASGAAQHWNFRSLKAEGLPIVSAVTVDALGRFAVNEGNNATFYFEPSGNANLYNGFESPAKIVVYDRPVTKLRFPFAFGNSFSEAYTANGLFLADTIASLLEGTYSVTADAYGSIVLPDGCTFDNVLRMKTTDRYREQICGTTETLIEKYLWYTPEYPFPVFTTVQAVSGYADSAERDTLQAAYYALLPDAGSQTDDTSANNETSGGNSTTVHNEPVINLYPNPATSFIDVYSEVELLQYQLRHVMGTVHISQKVSKHESPLRIQLHGLSPGWYVLNVETAGGWLVRTFVIQ